MLCLAQNPWGQAPNQIGSEVLIHRVPGAGPPVEGGLPPIAVYQIQISLMAHRHRGQAPSHIGSEVFIHFVSGAEPLWEVFTHCVSGAKPLWEGACPRWRCISYK